MDAATFFRGLKFEDYKDYSRVKIAKEVFDLEDIEKGIIPLSEFIKFLTILHEQHEEKEHLYLRSREAGDWYTCLSVVLYKDKSPEQLQALREADLKSKEAADLREKYLYLQLKAKYEPGA